MDSPEAFSKRAFKVSDRWFWSLTAAMITLLGVAGFLLKVERAEFSEGPHGVSLVWASMLLSLATMVAAALGWRLWLEALVGCAFVC